MTGTWAHPGSGRRILVTQTLLLKFLQTLVGILPGDAGQQIGLINPSPFGALLFAALLRALGSNI
jgi:hypothetical protein